ncbi:hypothetical protein ACTHOQ_05315 [Solibacillus silvestris]|uniref:hypothetical protein n=1 Tax=Solibacillus silvestris TaxID=76853 RepID=UPI003F7EF710
MFKKQRIFMVVIMGFILVAGYVLTFPQWLFPGLYPTFVETIESNWGLSLPPPEKEVDIYNDRGGFHGDGDAITELYYNNESDVELIKALSKEWVSGEKFETESLPERVLSLIKETDKDASYFFLQESGFDYIILELKGNKVTIFESYI